jgi:hypothetical protein
MHHCATPMLRRRGSASTIHASVSSHGGTETRASSVLGSNPNIQATPAAAAVAATQARRDTVGSARRKNRALGDAQHGALTHPGDYHQQGEGED